MAESHKVDVFRSSKSSERRHSGRPQLPASSSALKTEVLIKTRSQCLSDWRHARRHQGRSRPPLPSAASGRPLRWRAPSGTYVAPSHGSVRSRRLRRARRRYCGVLRRIAAFCGLIAYCNKPPALDASDEPAGAADGADTPDAPGLLLRLNPGKLLSLLLLTRTKTTAAAAAATTTTTRGQLSQQFGLFLGAISRVGFVGPGQGPGPSAPRGGCPPPGAGSRRRLLRLIAAYCALLRLVAARRRLQALRPPLPPPPRPGGPFVRCTRLIAAYCGLLRPVAAYCGLLRLFAAHRGVRRAAQSCGLLGLVSRVVPRGD